MIREGASELTWLQPKICTGQHRGVSPFMNALDIVLKAKPNPEDYPYRNGEYPRVIKAWKDNVKIVVEAMLKGNLL